MPSCIVGSNGFLGKALKRYADTFTEDEWIGITRENYSKWRGYSFTNLVWCAGQSSKVMCGADHDKCWKENVDNLRDALHNFSPEKVVFISSYDVYAPGVTANESSVMDMSDDYVTSLSWYGKTKLAGEQVVRIWAEMNGRESLVLRCNGFSGPGLRKNVIYDLTRPSPRLFVEWDSRFQFVHVDKFAEILFALLKNITNETLNVTSPDIVTPMEIAYILNVDIGKVKMSNNLPTIDAIMNTSKLQATLAILGNQMPSCREAVLKWNEPLY